MAATSALRKTLPGDTMSMADSLPDINFGFEELRDRMAQFTQRFDEFIAQGRKQVLEERNQFRRNAAKNQGQTSCPERRRIVTDRGAEEKLAKERAIEDVRQKLQAHERDVGKEQAEAKEVETALESVTIQRDARAGERHRLKEEVAATHKAIGQHVEAQRAHAAQLDAQARFNAPELDFWTDVLALRLEGTGRVDRLRFAFTHIDERDWEREAWFELCTERRDYEVADCRPRLDAERLERCVETLNGSRDLGRFLKGMRELFVEALKH